jgi:predicted metal-dependent peptidase
MLSNETLEDINNIICLLIIDVPFCIPILKLDFDSCSDLWAKTDGRTIFINEEKWKTLDPPEKTAVIFHEFLHIGLFHHRRMKDRKQREFAVACDFLANSIIKENYTFMKLPNGAYYDSQYSNRAVEDIYQDLALEVQKKKKGEITPFSAQKGKPIPGLANKDDAVKNIANGSYGNNPLSEDISEEPNDGKDNDEFGEEVIKAAEHHKKIKGDLPGAFQREMERLKDSAKVPWQVILQSLVKQVLFYGGNRSYAHCKSWGWLYKIAIAGEINKKKAVITVICDTSGSIYKTQLSEFLVEIEKILKYSEYVNVITADCKVHENVKVKKISELTSKNPLLKFKGGGGTSFVPALELAAKLRSDLTIYFTDGQGKFGTKPRGLDKLLWILIDKTVKPPFGKYIYIN